MAFVALAANKLRSFLTMLGVIIGVGSVIIMISFIQGARQQVVSEFAEDGANLLFAFYNPKRDSQRRGTFDGLRMEDVEAIEERVGSIRDISPTVEQTGKVTRGKKNYSMTLVGVTYQYFGINNLKLARGRWIEDQDGDNWDKVCVIGDRIRKEMFGKEDPIGQPLVMVVGENRVPFTVIGYNKYKGKSGFGGTSADEQVFIPLNTMQKRVTGSDKIGGLSARAIAGVTADQAADEVFTVIKQRHPENAQDVVVDTQEGLLKRLDSVLMIFQVVLGGVGGLSLLVGGIGIMNIMLVSVTERTREIGIRKAVGAKRGDILVQFITESMAVSGVGGMIGVAFGYMSSSGIMAATQGKFKTFVPFWAAVLGFTFAVAVGMFFGIYPAWRASKLDPIQALRYE
ncbi:MAG: ABC transporter permease [Capsulimonadales bacterium]|nr:ABC transporter permease [Capsulimonadales bacterium]